MGGWPWAMALKKIDIRIAVKAVCWVSFIPGRGDIPAGAKWMVSWKLLDAEHHRIGATAECSRRNGRM